MGLCKGIYREEEEEEVGYSWLRAIKCGTGMVFWELEEHEVAYSCLRAFQMWPWRCVLGTRRARSGLQ